MKYGNSFLHILSAVPLQQSPFRIKHVIACVANYQSQHGLKKNSIKLVDLSNILWALKHKLYIRRGVSFDFNTMQHVVEILQAVLDEVKVISVEASHSICKSQKIAVFCNTCYCSSVSEENLDIVTYQYQLTSKLLWTSF